MNEPVHSLMKASGQLPKEWELTQCLFGEHLLRQYPGKVVAFPDIDGYDEWVRKLADYPDLGVTVSPVLQRSATPEDLADWLLRYMFGPAPFCHSERSPQGGVEESPWRREFLKIADVLDPESHAEVEALIEELGLEVWRGEKLSEGISDEVPP